MELIRHNAQEKELREKAEMAEKMRDKQMLDAALAYERQIQDFEL